MLTDTVNIILATLVLLSQIFFVLGILYLLFFRKKFPVVLSVFSKNGILFSFIVAMVATLGSLYYSNVAGFNPCDLCWFQRIFMYPEVLLLGLALYKKESKIIDYALSLAVGGWIISAYHNYTFYKVVSSTFCGIGESCTTRYVIEFGYITIPMMALTGFTLIIALLLTQKLTKF
ncbi:MAG: disulfide oxidoreductase [Candidatus Staskawiczbacteria bacterium]|nr:disulfide oxidoreductase [Candidatus Staskawiczbacteria bacterium]